jgi:hypothetical protein
LSLLAESTLVPLKTAWILYVPAGVLAGRVYVALARPFVTTLDITEEPTGVAPFSSVNLTVPLSTRPVDVATLATSVRVWLPELAGTNVSLAAVVVDELEIVSGKVARYHVHLLLSYRPNQDISQIVQSLEEISSRILLQEFSHLRKKFGADPSGERLPGARTAPSPAKHKEGQPRS